VLDIKLIRERPQEVRQALARRGEEAAATLEQVLECDSRWRAATSEAESLRAKQRAASEQLARARRAGEEVGALQGELRELSERVKALREQAEQERAALEALLARLPNLPDPTAPDGPEDVQLRVVGAPRRFSFTPRDHLQLAGERIDIERAVRLSGSRFAYLRGELVLVELAASKR
jgi:seryl-tRNA synthetase